MTSTGWIDFGEPDDTGLWVECPLCGRMIRNLRMAKGSHIAWHHRNATPPAPCPWDSKGDAEMQSDQMALHVSTIVEALVREFVPAERQGAALNRYSRLSGPPLPGAQEARWALFNAISEWCSTHQLGPDDEGDNPVRAALDAYVASRFPQTQDGAGR